MQRNENKFMQDKDLLILFQMSDDDVFFNVLSSSTIGNGSIDTIQKLSSLYQILFEETRWDFNVNCNAVLSVDVRLE